MMNRDSTDTREFRLSVLVPTRNRPRELERLLHSLQKQTMRDFTVLIVDASDNETARVREVIEKFPDLRVILDKTSQVGSCTQRNLGLSKIKTEWILFCDDDCAFEPNAIEELYRYADAHPEIAVFSLHIFEDRSCFYWLAAWLKKGFGISSWGPDFIVKNNGINVVGNPDRKNMKIEWLQSGALVVSRDRIARPDLLNFNEKLEIFSGYGSSEDVYFTYNLHLHGYHLGFARDALVRHLPAKEARDDRRLRFCVRTFNRYQVWRDLIYPRKKESKFAFHAANVLFILQYAMALFKGDTKPLLGHMDAMKAIFKDIRNIHSQ